jgi:hypothetical protein
VERGLADLDRKDGPPRWPEDIADIRKTMATKEDIAEIMIELADIKRRLKDVEAAVENHFDSKEIDHAFERIAAIEKHLVINKRIAA